MKNQNIIIIILIITVIIFSLFSKKIKTTTQNIMEKLPRGYRNNNPGNIEKTKDLWRGETTGTDKRFKTFVSMSYGYRAIFILLRSYISKNFDTIEKIINRYAPANENATKKYIETVCKITGLNPFKKLNFNDNEEMKKIVAAISFVENGLQPDLTKVNEGYNLI